MIKNASKLSTSALLEEYCPLWHAIISKTPYHIKLSADLKDKLTPIQL